VFDQSYELMKGITDKTWQSNEEHFWLGVLFMCVYSNQTRVSLPQVSIMLPNPFIAWWSGSQSRHQS